VLAFLHDNIERLPLEKTDALNSDRFQALNAFRANVMTGRMVKMWSEAKELPGLVALSISKAIKMKPGVGWIRGNSAASNEILQEINRLRKENDELKTAVSKVSGAAPEINDLADLDQSCKIVGSYYYYQGDVRTKKIYHQTMELKKIFALIVPFLEEPKTEDAVRQLVAERTREAINHNLQRIYDLTINDDTYLNIRVQLELHKLIIVRREKTTAGDFAVFWWLTPKGKSMMYELLANRSNFAEESTDSKPKA
jgi:hypothetical protein